MFYRRSNKSGLPPGAAIHVGKRLTERLKITVIDYDENTFNSFETDNVASSIAHKCYGAVTWINVDGLHDPAAVESICSHYGIHSLTVEDILNTDQQPKIDYFEKYILVEMATFSTDHKKDIISPEQLSILIGSNFVLTFREKYSDLFIPLAAHLAANAGKIRKNGADYLAYSIIDIAIDSYFDIVEEFGDDISLLEDKLSTADSHKIPLKIHAIRKEMQLFRKSIWPLRGIINSLLREETPLISTTIKPYLKDLYDHIFQINFNSDSMRDMLSGMLEIHLTYVNNRMNEIMKFLTLIGTIFMPLTFISSIYGMNFEHMPELKWRWGYFISIAVMFIIGLSLFVFFKRKKWI